VTGEYSDIKEDAMLRPDTARRNCPTTYSRFYFNCVSNSFKFLGNYLAVLFIWGGLLSTVYAGYNAPEKTLNLGGYRGVYDTFTFAGSSCVETYAEAADNSCLGGTINIVNGIYSYNHQRVAGQYCRIVRGYFTHQFTIGVTECTLPEPEYFLSYDNQQTCEGGQLCDNNCPLMAGNPINSFGGNKYQSETDVDRLGMSGIALTRHYNRFQTLEGAFGVSWHHNYQNNLVPDSIRVYKKHKSGDPQNSGIYKERVNACLQGWPQIRPWIDELPAGNVVARYEYGQCRLYVDNQYWRSLPIFDNNSASVAYANQTNQNLLAWKVQRHDGRVYRFQQVNDIWVSPGNPAVKLQETPTGFVFTDENDTQETYDSQHRLVTITERNGRQQQLIYNAESRLDRVEGQGGESLTFTYHPDGRLERITDHTDRVWQYQYDDSGILERVLRPDSTQRQYLYEDGRFPQALTGIIDERGARYASWTYDGQGRAISSEHAGGVEKVRLSFVDKWTTIATNSRNISTTYTFTIPVSIPKLATVSGPGCASCGSGDSQFQYDAIGNLIRKTVYGMVTEFGNYDINGNPGIMIEAKGTAQERRADYIYDPRFASKVKTVTEPSVYATGNKVTTYDYDDFGNITRIRVDGVTPAGLAIAREINLQYLGPFNQLSQIDGPRTAVSDITTLDYYPNDPAEGNNRARLKRVTTAGIVLRDNLQYSATGKLLSESRLNGVTVTYTYYPGNDRLESVTESAGSTSRATRWTYLATGEVETITRGHGTPDATILTFGYDDARRLTRITDGLGNYIQYTLDMEGNKEKEDIYDAQNVLHKSLTQTFDDYDRLNLFSQANESSDSDFAADGTLDNVTDGKGTVTDYGYDDLKRLVTVTQDLGGTDTSTQDALTQYGYDIHGNLTAVTDPNNGNTTYVYDDLGNLLSQTSPDTGTTAFTHDAAGNVLTRTDAKGQSFAYSYDALNRLATLNAPGTADDITYTYDTCNNGVGRLCAVIIGDGAGNKTVTYAYDAFGNVISQQGINYSYDSVSRIKTLTYPSGNVVTYIYDAAGQVSQVDLQQDAQTTTLASEISYAPFGPVTSMTYGNGHTLSQGVDSAYRFTDHTVTGALQLINSLYDANGNLSQVDNNLTTVSNVYSYDALNRLDTANGTFGNQDFGYDKNGNRLQLLQDGNTLSYAYETNSNRLAVAANDDVIIDPNGNITGQGLWAYTHTTHNRLASVSNDSVQVGAYVYNGLGQRVSKTVNSVTHQYVYGLSGELLQETDGATSVEYVYLNGQPLALIQQGNVYYLHNDHLGTPRAVTDAAKTVVWRWDSDPFGATAANDDPDNDGIAFTLNLRFPGQYYDSETGLHYNYFRYYDPRTGQYITSDPIGLAGGLNTYGYVGGNPVVRMDSKGLYYGVSDVWQDVGEELIPYKNPQNYIDAGKDALKIGGTALAFSLPVTRAGQVLYGGYQMCKVTAARQFLNQSIRTSIAVESATIAMADTAAFTYSYSSQLAYSIWLEAYVTSPIWAPATMEYGLGYYDLNPPPQTGPAAFGWLLTNRESFYGLFSSDCDNCEQK
jgi:RHS repeat-associated protein